MTNTSLQQRLRDEDPTAFEEVYKDNQEAFFNYALKFNLDKDTVLDVYQDATIALYQNFVSKQLVIENGTLRTYLFAIGKYKMYNILKKRKKVILKDAPEKVADFEIEVDNSPSEQQKQLAINFKNMSPSCQDILKMYYYRNLTIKEIVALTHYKDENTVKSHKSRCLKGLRQLINSPK
ncbi:hypothetical protein ULMS_07020 [Patiriisocius marinistellae]|uniref:Sigma-70 family RNA polymerase sigma factor n=1 Tax=Patiriisocius marinistellae TaxID=2494560 RepID=A0A5J4FVP2_9FLAO|nr:sigma-70 family RNA polymerase sigma factor [Patiriisocius marinistellae]GEQ85194.1 hypothetical protein ULMS_07020 [Patiriisocius marinistellae]